MSRRQLVDPKNERGLLCAGRLDADSTGLMLWTTDSGLVQRIIGPETRIEKEYLVRVTGHESWGTAQLRESMQWLEHGISLDGVPLRPARAKWLNDAQMQIVLTEGRHRQIRRMCQVIGVQVRALKRVRIGEVRLGALPTGYWRPVNPVQLPLGERLCSSKPYQHRRSTCQDIDLKPHIVRRVVIEPPQQERKEPASLESAHLPYSSSK
mmetsp:Transcript_20213/g.46651  ORF Transcript_20213/g.46651 Transcript_20213/m.46651 type:complete len:209 (+) Transcript_20213:262-888(+)